MRICHCMTMSLTTCLITGLTVTPAAMAATADRVSNWNVTAVTATAMAGQIAVVQSRSLAMVQAAVHDALNAIDRRFESYALEGVLDSLASADAAVATAAHDTLVGVIPVGALPFTGFGSVAQQTAAVNFANSTYTSDLSTIPDGDAKTRGIWIGQAAAQAILTRRFGDGATAFVPYTPGTDPGDWQPTPNPVPFDPPAAADRLPANAPWWGDITTFVLRASDQFQTDGPPALTSEAYAIDYNEVKAIGAKLSADRTPDQTQIARFWYEGSPAGWNRIARIVAETHGLDPWERARLLGLVNLAMADGFIAGWKDKYTFNFWRPVTAIRAGETDGNDNTIPDPTWDSLLNSPAIPDYPSTHSVLGGAASEVLRRYFRHDDIAFTMTSGPPFAGITRSYASFSQAAQENGNSRVYAGIHFRMAVEDGIAQGKQVGRFVFTHALKPVEDEQ
jgi:vanadium-dependent haloperoxidase-like protein